MRKEEFLRQLEYLLQDIPDEDKEEAIAYYRDYLEEAGSEHEEQAIEEFGSPERVAAIIRADISGNLQDDGSFTETGYVDERFKDPNYKVAKRLDLPDEKENAGEKEQQFHEDTYTEGTYADSSYQGRFRSERFRERYTKSKTTDTVYTYKEKKPWTNRLLKLILVAILLVLASPILLGTGGVILGAVAAVLALIVGVAATILTLTAAAFIIAVALAAFGVAFILTTPFDSLFLFGIAMIGLGCGLIGTVVMVLIFKAAAMLLPLIWKGIVSLWNLLTGKGKEGKTE